MITPETITETESLYKNIALCHKKYIFFYKLSISIIISGDIASYFLQILLT